VSILDTLLVDNRIGSPEFLGGYFDGAFTGSTFSVMPILLWYMPFTMFYGMCDLLFKQPLRCVVEIDAVSEGVFVKGEKGKEYYVRVGNTTKSLEPADTHAYLAART
jgi:hypothetical protein